MLVAVLARYSLRVTTSTLPQSSQNCFAKHELRTLVLLKASIIRVQEHPISRRSHSLPRYLAISTKDAEKWNLTSPAKRDVLTRDEIFIAFDLRVRFELTRRKFQLRILFGYVHFATLLFITSVRGHLHPTSSVENSRVKGIGNRHIILRCTELRPS